MLLVPPRSMRSTTSQAGRLWMAINKTTEAFWFEHNEMNIIGTKYTMLNINKNIV